MHDVLVAYKQVEMCFDDEGRITIDMDELKTVTLSYDEKPGIQTLKNIVSNLPPTEKHGTVGRDHEYKRLGTVHHWIYKTDDITAGDFAEADIDPELRYM